ncbi:hypothetical protein SLEP1_g11681 [Rubroshorea leprosula]|nr:hypothetical protein SLEP1_g11681 [Rubroshorea leprosula]
MPARNSTGNPQQHTPLRRSPRLLQLSNCEKSQELNTSKSKSGDGRARSVSLPRGSTSTGINTVERSQEACSDKVAKKSRKLSNDLLDSSNQMRSRKSARLNDGSDGFSSLRRSPSFLNKLEGDNVVQEYRRNKCRDSWVFQMVRKMNCRNKGRSSVVDSVNESINKEVNGGNVDEGACLSNQNAEKRRQGKIACQGNEKIETNLKRKCSDDAIGVVQGWTKEQEVALQRAYFAAKPSPHFWKKVSKLVPGKSAQDCFDKIHSDLIIPPQPQPRSKAIRVNSSLIQQFSLFASKLLESTEPKNKRHHLVNQENEADLFPILEPNINPSTHVLPESILSTPKNLEEKEGFLHKCQEMSFAGSKKTLPRFCSSCTTALVSPLLQHLQTNTHGDSSDLDDNDGASGDDEEGEIECKRRKNLGFFLHLQVACICTGGWNLKEHKVAEDMDFGWQRYQSLPDIAEKIYFISSVVDFLNLKLQLS